MRTAMALRRDDPWARRVVQMVGVSTAAHVAIFASVALFGAWLATHRPEPIVAYSVELTDLRLQRREPVVALFGAAAQPIELRTQLEVHGAARRDTRLCIGEQVFHRVDLLTQRIEPRLDRVLALLQPL